MSEPQAQMPFDVPLHDLMLLRLPGKRPGTVLTVEMMAYTVRICEYTEPLSYERFWCYSAYAQDDAHGHELLARDAQGAVLAACAAIEAVCAYLVSDQEEPAGWIKAVAYGPIPNGQPYDVRRRAS